MWTIFFYLFVYLRINQAFERIQTRYHVAFYLQIIIWGLTLWASILLQIRNNPMEKTTCGTEVTGNLNDWVVTNALYGLFIGFILKLCVATGITSSLDTLAKGGSSRLRPIRLALRIVAAENSVLRTATAVLSPLRHRFLPAVRSF